MGTNRFSFSTIALNTVGQNTTVNKALNQIDALLHFSPEQLGLNTPPTIVNGEAFVIGGSPTAAWSNNANDIVVAESGAWKYFTPEEGIIAGKVRAGTYAGQSFIYDGTVWRRFSTGSDAQQVGARLDTPANNDQVPLMYTQRAITITEVLSVLDGSSTPTVVWNIMHAADRSVAGTQVFTVDPSTTSVTTGETDNSGFGDATIPAGRFVWIEIEGAPTGTVDAAEWFVSFTEDGVI